MADTSITKGLDHVFGLLNLDTSLFVTLQTDDYNEKRALEVMVQDSSGRVITVRNDDTIKELTFTGVLKEGVSIPEVGGYFPSALKDGQGNSYSTWIIKDITDAGTNSSFRRVTVKLSKYQEINS